MNDKNFDGKDWQNLLNLVTKVIIWCIVDALLICWSYNKLVPVFFPNYAPASVTLWQAFAFVVFLRTLRAILWSKNRSSKS